MSDELKNRFKHRLVSGEEQAPDGHEARFRQRLLAAEPTRASNKLSWLWYAAAAITVLLIIGAVVNGISTENENARDRSLADVSMKVGQLEYQLSNHISRRQADIDHSDPAIQRHLKHFKKLEDQYALLEQELNKNFGDERIVQAMIENYKLRVIVLENIVAHLKIQNKPMKTSNKEVSQS
ncbi:hypothetical protein [Sanyastnella coralliicola]|uniref:hypothetical protein n=1 Tax=Sanyastnella coralliicola TaxID=3069118 RepID=UPI0027BA0C32|nr:hypothetical protein [Longitalea sp. SCSIO 12813]